MNWVLLSFLLIALLFPSASRGEGFDLPAIPAPLKPLLDARIYNAKAIAGSLPAHPMGERFLDDFLQFVVAGMEREKIDLLTAHRIVCVAYGNDDLGIFAVDCYVAGRGVQDGFLAWLIATHPDLRASCRAFSRLQMLGTTPPTPDSGRVAAFARLQAAAGLLDEVDALRETLLAWSEAVDASQARFAGVQGRALLNATSFERLRSVLGFDPVPTALLRAIADALRDFGAQFLQATCGSPANTLPVPLLEAVTAVACFLDADTDSVDFLQRADVATASLPDDVRVYLALPIATRLIQQFELDDAAARLDAAAALDTAGHQHENIAMLLRKCRAGVGP